MTSDAATHGFHRVEDGVGHRTQPAPSTNRVHPGPSETIRGHRVTASSGNGRMRNAAAARRFATDLNRAMTARSMTRADIYRVTGSCSTGVKKWLTGDAYPDHDVVIVLADLLTWPSLVTRSIADRTGTCEACGRPTFVTRGAVPARFCGPTCRRRTSDRRLYQRQGQQDRKVMRRSLELYQAAVDRFCRECAVGEGICRTEDCSLRDVSPLPFIPLTRASRRAA